MIVGRIAALAIGYCCGLFLSGYLYGKKQHVDVTKMGSGNVGATNTLRNLGWKAGAVTLIGDVGKVFAAIFLVWLIFHKSYPETVRLFELYAGFGAVLGHDFPVYMKFKGGKGISCTGGIVLGFCPIAAPVSLGLFLLTVLVTRYVSLGSILGVISLFIQILIFGHKGWLGIPAAYMNEVYVIFAIITIIGIAKHHANIKRLLNGTENKIGSKKTA
ncbi:MAG: glycerol-3-phosphate 1-O-acyltransferase PlsY [Lachnospiraceae bacterium]|nr:glycerol-3-phosphate 1-O-acyltransferase PlsY [Lachnospiraceae bacterium]